MSTLGRTRLRLAADTASFEAPIDALRRATPQFWRGNDVQFEIAVFFNGALQDVSNLASLTLEIRPLGANGGPPDPSFTPLMGATITSFDNTTTLDDWNAGAKQHALVAFTAAQSNIAAGAAWLSIFAITNDSPGRVLTLCAGPVRVLEDGAVLATTPTPAADTFYTAAQSDARFAPIGAGGDGAPASDSNPLMDGSAAPGTATSYSRADHVHPTDTSRAGATHASQHASSGSDPVTLAQSQVTGLTSALSALAPLASPALTGSPTAPTVSTATDSSTKIATTAFVQAAITAAGGGAGTVTSVALSVPGFLSVSGSPITSSGTLAVTLATQNANLVFAGPGSGSAAAPTFRSLVATDIPNISESQVTNLASDLAALAPLASPALTGTPTAPTVSTATDSSTKVATTAFVQAAITAAGGGSGTVTSVAMSVPGFLSVSGSPITTSGTLAVSLATQSANLVFAGPGSGSAAAPTFRALVAADLPTALTNNSTIAGSPPASSDNSAKIATTAWVNSYTFAVSNDGSGHYWINGSGAIQVQQNNDSLVSATLSVYGLFAASGEGTHMFLNTAAVNDDVLGIRHDGTEGQSAIDFYSSKDITETSFLKQNAIYGAIGFDYNGKSNNYPSNERMYLSFSPAFKAPTFAAPTSGVGEFVLQQEGIIGGSYKSAYAWACNNDWSIYRSDPDHNEQFRMYGVGNSGYYDTNWTQQDSSNHYWGTPQGLTLRLTSTDSKEMLVSLRSSNFSVSGIEAFGPSRGMIGTNAADGLSLAASDSSGGYIRMFSGGYAAAKERLKITPAGDFVASNVVTSDLSATLVNSQYQFTVYDNSGTAVFKIRYKDSGGTVKTGTVALS